MRIVARLKQLDEILKLINLEVDVFLIDTPLSVKKISLDMYNHLDEIASYKKDIYLLINKMIHETDIESLKDILEVAKKPEITAVVCGDMTVMVIAKEFGIEKKIIYQPGTFNTNSFDNEYFLIKNIKGITISKEITLEEIERIFKNKKTELSLVGHGFIDMFYSKRNLLTNYFIYKNIEKENIKENDSFRLKEEMRPDSLYPVFEDMGGTHVFRDKALESFAEIEVLEKHLDDFFIERIFINDEEYYDILKAYQDKNFVPEFLNKYQDKYNKGFYYQYTEKLKGELSEN